MLDLRSKCFVVDVCDVTVIQHLGNPVVTILSQAWQEITEGL
jgi:hypothetical protein